MNVCFHYHFHGVQQGLFASGCLYEANNPEPGFLWVFDCGSMSAGADIIVRSRIGDLKRFANDKEAIDLLALSHFDNDHISGVAALLEVFKVETLIIPYVPLWERLLIAFGNAIYPGDDRLAPFLDPVEYFSTIEGSNIERIIIVLPSEGDDEPGLENDFEFDGPDLPEGPWKQIFNTVKLDKNDPLRGEHSVDTSIEYLATGKSINILGLWEFVPYNAERTDVRSSGFREAVEAHRESLLTTSTHQSKATILEELKGVYDEEFGRSARARNVISLFLYAGPVYSTWNDFALRRRVPEHLPPYPARCPCFHRIHPRRYGPGRKCSVLYSGDGYLNTKSSLTELKKQMGETRMKNLGVFQVELPR